MLGRIGEDVEERLGIGRDDPGDADESDDDRLIQPACRVPG